MGTCWEAVSGPTSLSRQPETMLCCLIFEALIPLARALLWLPFVPFPHEAVGILICQEFFTFLNRPYLSATLRPRKEPFRLSITFLETPAINHLAGLACQDGAGHEFWAHAVGCGGTHRLL